jgi:hypothetical protein
MIIDSEVREDEFTAVAEVALNDMFGYSNQLRGSTQGKGKFLNGYWIRVFDVLILFLFQVNLVWSTR